MEAVKGDFCNSKILMQEASVSERKNSLIGANDWKVDQVDQELRGCWAMEASVKILSLMLTYGDIICVFNESVFSLRLVSLGHNNPSSRMKLACFEIIDVRPLTAAIFVGCRTSDDQPWPAPRD